MCENENEDVSEAALLTWKKCFTMPEKATNETEAPSILLRYFVDQMTIAELTPGFMKQAVKKAQQATYDEAGPSMMFALINTFCCLLDERLTDQEIVTFVREHGGRRSTKEQVRKLAAASGVSLKASAEAGGGL